jgi:hypothetical protein
MHTSMDTDTKDKKPMKPLIAAPVDGGSASDRERVCTPEDRIVGSSPVAAGPLHSPSFTSSPSADVASSEVSKPWGRRAAAVRSSFYRVLTDRITSGYLVPLSRRKRVWLS